MVDTCRDMHISVLGAATFGSPLEVHLTDFGQNDIGTMSSTEGPNWPAEEAPLGDNVDGNAWYDAYDVPVPAKADPHGANGRRN